MELVVGVFLLMVILFLVVMFFVLGNFFIHLISDIVIRKKIADIVKKENIYSLKYPASLICILLMLDAGSYFFDTPDIFIPLVNTLLILVSTFLVLFIINVLFRLWKVKWVENGRTQAVIDSISHIKQIVLGTLFLFVVISVMLVWNLDIPAVFVSLVGIILNNVILTAAIVFVLFVILSQAVLYLFRTYLSNMVRKTDTPYDDIILAKLEYPVSLIIIFVGFEVTLDYLGFTDTLLVRISRSVLVVIIMHLLTTLIDNLIEYWERKWHKHSKSYIDDSIFTVAHNASKVLIVVVSIMVLLFIWGFDGDELKALLLSLSVMGVILGFALKDALTNVISGISIVTDHTFKTNDLIKLDTGEMGVVTKIGLRSTKIQTFDHEIVTIPNSVLATAKILNYSQPDHMLRLVIPVSVEYGSDPKKVRKILLDYIKKKDFVVNPEKANVRFIEMGEYSIKFHLIFHIDDYKKRFDIQSDVTTEVYEILNKNNLDIPFPTRTIYVKNGKIRSGRNKKRPASKSR